LVDLLADTVDISEGDVVIDAGCGFGEQDVRIARRKRPSRLLAINVTEGQLAYAREHNSHPAIAYMNCSATHLPLPDSSVDKVMSLEAAFHFHTREAFLREAFRVLRPGGRIGVIDLVPLERNGKPLTGGLRGSLERWGHQVPTENLYGTKRYGEILEEVGFSDCTLQSINEEVVPGFFRFVGELLANPEATQRLHPLVRRAYARLRSPLGTPFDMSDYILVAAQKPAS
jgi:erythromycin 3''-O-methyltransferase